MQDFPVQNRTYQHDRHDRSTQTLLICIIILETAVLILIGIFVLLRYRNAALLERHCNILEREYGRKPLYYDKTADKRRGVMSWPIDKSLHEKTLDYRHSGLLHLRESIKSNTALGRTWAGVSASLCTCPMGKDDPYYGSTKRPRSAGPRRSSQNNRALIIENWVHESNNRKEEQFKGEDTLIPPATTPRPRDRESVRVSSQTMFTLSGVSPAYSKSEESEVISPVVPAPAVLPPTST